jgi:hypothetical protein
VVNHYLNLVREANSIVHDGKDHIMGIFIRGKACPKCGGIDRHRIRRSFWMRFLPGSKYYLCEHCEAKFFSVLELVSINWPFGAVA